MSPQIEADAKRLQAALREHGIHCLVITQHVIVTVPDQTNGAVQNESCSGEDT